MVFTQGEQLLLMFCCGGSRTDDVIKYKIQGL